MSTSSTISLISLSNPNLHAPHTQPGLHISTSIPQHTATANAAFSLSSLLQTGGGGGGERTSVIVSGESNRHHSEPGLMYTTDIPAHNPNMLASGTGNGKRSASSSSTRHQSTRTRDMSLLKSRGGYSMHAAGHHSADETGESLNCTMY